jgi:hypothetical protein
MFNDMRGVRTEKGKSSTTAQGLELNTVSGIVSENRVINRAIGL